MTPWVCEEMKTVQLKDKRLDDRLAEVLSALGGRPTASLPAALGGNAELAAAYRLFNNEKVDFEKVLSTAVLFRQTIQVRGRKAKVSCEKRGRRQPRQSRTANVEVRACQVTLRAPWRPDRRLPDVTVNVVLIREVDPPANDAPVQWLLLTSLPIDDVEQILQVIQYYSTRWMIEVFFRTLKSGCRVEERRFETLERMLPCLAVYMVVAWRTLFVCRLGRSFPDIDCEAVFEPAEWKSVYQMVHRQPPPKIPPTLSEMVRMVAQLGGYVNRKRADEPGPQTVGLGLQRMQDIAACWVIFGPEAEFLGPEAELEDAALV